MILRAKPLNPSAGERRQDRRETPEEPILAPEVAFSSEESAAFGDLDRRRRPRRRGEIRERLSAQWAQWLTARRHPETLASALGHGPARPWRPAAQPVRAAHVAAPPRPPAPAAKRQSVPFSETPSPPRLPRLIQEVGNHVSLGIVFAGQLTGWLLESWLPGRD